MTAQSVTQRESTGSILTRLMPGLHTLQNYQREWLFNDVLAGLVLTAILVPVGMGYAEASGVPPINGLYATIVPLLIYALFGPSRIMVLGPDSTLAAVIAALILPLVGADAQRAIELAALLALMSGAFCLVIGMMRMGMVADLLSKPIRIGFLNAIALTVLVGQLPKVFGFSVKADTLVDKATLFVQGILLGRTNGMALLIGGGSLALILLMKQWRPHWPGVLIAVVLATLVTGVGDLDQSAGLVVVGGLPQGLPSFHWPQVFWSDAMLLLPGAVMIALLSFADTSVLSRSLAQRGGYTVDQNQEMVALGMANMCAGLFQGFSISSSSSRTPVAESAGARTQMTGVVGALAICALLVIAPNLLGSLPSAVLGAVVIAACLSFADLDGMWELLRLRRMEFVLSVISFLGVAFVGVIEGIVIAIVLAMLVLVWNAWHPNFSVLARVDGVKGYHDVARHPGARQIPGLVLFRWNAQIFFANSEIFRSEIHQAVAQAATPTRRVDVAADAITDVDVTAAEMLLVLYDELKRQGIELRFAGLRSVVKDRLKRYGTLDVMGHDIFSPTTGNAVNRYRETYQVDWKDWDEP
jgi:high affinity sulfate transporter 1